MGKSSKITAFSHELSVVLLFFLRRCCFCSFWTVLKQPDVEIRHGCQTMHLQSVCFLPIICRGKMILHGFSVRHTA